MSILKASATYFALVFGAGFLLGTARVLLLVPWLGMRLAELLEMPIMLVVVVFSARFVAARFAVLSSDRTALAIGLLALAFLLAAEILLVALQGHTLREYIRSRDPVSGSVYVVMLVLFAAMPFLVARLSARARLR